MREESRAVYREAIVEAAMRIFGRTGFHETKIADIATEAGVATGTLYNYFSSKEEIFESILDDGRACLAAALAEKASVEDPLARMREVVKVMFEFLEEHGMLFTMYMQLGANPMDLKRANDAGDEEFRQQLLGLLAGSIAEAGERMRPDFSAETLAWVFGGLIHGAITEWIVGGCQPGLRTRTDTIMELFLNGATPR
ncbi:TetR/AcrR family transcriptional regulator [Enhygromyxa salina]|uniref:TetR/AcrR family transcriptional regulator n=1 Tax=Enhygromyxa salina TaxID=215803 RepID=UPI0015E67805|nr:TetR/AcrR family transcriptional regulator [Enhygromyxa salina]